VGGLAIDVDDAGMALAAIADEPRLVAGKIDRKRDPAARDIGVLRGHQLLALIEFAQLGLGERRRS
jgi:hypothetical protein